MSVFFVYRSPYAGPTGKLVRKIGADTILDWFRRSWDVAACGRDEDEWGTSAMRWVETEFGFGVYGLWSIFAAAREHALRPPERDDQLADYLSKYLYVEGSVLVAPQTIQAHTNDDELEMVYYLFDESFAHDHPERTAYLLHDGWRLPAASRNRRFTPDIGVPELLPRGGAAGTTYLVFLAPHASLYFEDLSRDLPCRIEGARLPDLQDFLRHAEPGPDWPIELLLLRLAACRPRLRGSWLRRAFDEATALPLDRLKSWTSDRSILSTAQRKQFPDHLFLGPVEEARAELEAFVDMILPHADLNRRRLAQDRTNWPSLMAADDHLAQFSIRPRGTYYEGLYHQWIIFDDQWADENEHVAQNLLQYAGRWDVLSDPQPPRVL